MICLPPLVLKGTFVKSFPLMQDTLLQTCFMELQRAVEIMYTRSHKLGAQLRVSLNDRIHSREN